VTSGDPQLYFWIVTFSSSPRTIDDALKGMYSSVRQCFFYKYLVFLNILNLFHNFVLKGDVRFEKGVVNLVFDFHFHRTHEAAAISQFYFLFS
jgi:hypothetical protein